MWNSLDLESVWLGSDTLTSCASVISVFSEMRKKKQSLEEQIKRTMKDKELIKQPLVNMMCVCLCVRACMCVCVCV